MVHVCSKIKAVIAQIVAKSASLQAQKTAEEYAARWVNRRFGVAHDEYPVLAMLVRSVDARQLLTLIRYDLCKFAVANHPHGAGRYYKLSTEEMRAAIQKKLEALPAMLM